MPLSQDPRKRARQLANLSAGPPPPPLGNQRARRHGGYAQVAIARLDAKVRDVFDALAADAPLRDSTGGLPHADTAQVRLAAECLCRLDDVSDNVRDHGLLDASGGLRAVVELEGRLRREAADHLDALGMSPRSRAKLGLDLSRSLDLAQEWALQAADDALAADGDGEPAP